jgi:hypothetical protein
MTFADVPIADITFFCGATVPAVGLRFWIAAADSSDNRCRARAKSPTVRGEQSNRSKQPFRPPGGFARRCPRDGFYIAASGACRGHMRRSSTDTDRMSRSRSERSDADTVSGYETGFVITREWTVKIGYADSLAKSLASIQERFWTGYIALMFHKLPCAIRSSIRPERPLL